MLLYWKKEYDALGFIRKMLIFFTPVDLIGQYYFSLKKAMNFIIDIEYIYLFNLLIIF